MTAMDFQTLISGANIPCYANLSPGIQRVLRLALLQNVVNNLIPGVPTDYQSLLNDPNVACYANLSPGEQKILIQALLQMIITTLGGSPTPPSTWTPITPINGATLVEWLKADNISQGSNTAVSTWPHSAGADGTASGTAQPTFINPGQNNLPVVRFNGTTNIMAVAMSGVAQPYTLALAYRYNGSLSNNSIITSLGLFQNQASGQWQASAGTSQFIGTSDNNFHLAVMVFNGASSKYGFDGSALTTTNFGTGVGGAFDMGAAPGPTFFGQVDIAELLVYSGDATTSGYSNIFNYFNGRWA